MIQNKILTVIGKKGHGKTTLTNKLMIELNKASVIFDPRMQYDTTAKRRLHFKNGNRFLLWLNQGNYKEFKKYKFEAVVNAPFSEFEPLAEAVYKMHDITFVIDEVDGVFNTHKNNSVMMDIVNYGRHNKLNVITTSRRPARINRDLTSQTDVFYFTRMREPSDQKYIKDSVGQEFVKSVYDLDKFEFLRVEDDTKEIITTTKREFELLT